MGSRKIVFLARMMAHWPCKAQIKHPSIVNFSVTLLILMHGWIMWFWSWVRIAMLMRIRLRKCKHIKSICASARNVDCCDRYTWCINVICGDVAIGLLLSSMEQICAGDSYVCKGFWQKLGKYYLHSQGKVLWLLLVDCFCGPDSQLLQSFGALVGIDPGGVFLEYADEWQLSGYHWTGLPWPGFSEKSWGIWLQGLILCKIGEEQNLLQVLRYCGLLVKNSDMQVLKLWIHWDLRYMCIHIINEWWYLPFEDLLINVLKKLAATWSRRSHCCMQSSSLSDLQAYTSICSLWSIYITYTYTLSLSLSR